MYNKTEYIINNYNITNVIKEEKGELIEKVIIKNDDVKNKKNDIDELIKHIQYLNNNDLIEGIKIVIIDKEKENNEFDI